jgi:two-component system, NarL family, sensor kinase
LALSLATARADGVGTDMTETERRVAWLRLAAVPLLAAGESLPHPDAAETAFYVALGVFAGFAAGVLWHVYRSRVGRVFALAVTVADIVSITTLALLSGGGYSPARLAFFLVPVAVAFRFRPPLTALAGATTLIAFLVQALLHPSASGSEAFRFIAVFAGYLAWIGLAAVLFSAVLERRTRRVTQLAEARQRLMVDALGAEERERQALAEALHDHAIQNLLSARHDLEDVAESLPDPALRRADEALTETVEQLRDAAFELHPYVLEQAGLPAALRAVAQRAASQGHLALRLDLAADGANANDQLLFSAARELLSNVVRHADAKTVTLRLAHVGPELQFVVEDDGRGFPAEQLPERLAKGHVGLASQRVRVEAAGGTMTIASIPGEGTRVEIRVPGNGADVGR